MIALWISADLCPVDLSIVSSVVSNISTGPDDSSSSTVKSISPHVSSTRITIHGYAQSTVPTNESHIPNPHASSNSRTAQKENVLLSLQPQSPSIASEWLDGLLMLLNQQPITTDTNKLITLVSNYGLKIRLLNIRFDDPVFARDAPVVPSRDGLDDDYHYDVFGGS